MASPPNHSDEPRRGFIQQATAAVVGLVALLGPLAAGIVTFVNPLRRASAATGNFRRVTTLDAVPANGQPYRFPIIADRNDAWSHYPPEPIGAVFLTRKEGEQLPTAFTAICPHLGCNVDWKPADTCFFCPCHNASFAVTGERTDAKSPSPRDLDPLTVEIRNGNEVWVDYRIFKGGTAERVSV